MHKTRMVSAVLIAVVVLGSIVIFQLSTVKEQPKRLVVPDDYPTIQSAIDNANTGDTIYVKEGNYSVNYAGINIDKSVNLTGENNQDTIISGTADKSSKSLININAKDVTVSGFTLNCNGYQVGISSSNSSTRIIGNKIFNTITGISVDVSGDTISENKIANCLLHGIYCTASDSVIVANNITNCNDWGIIIDSCQYVTVQSNLIQFNGGQNDALALYTTGGIFLRWTGPFYVYNNNITDNLVGLLFGKNCSYSKVYSNNLLGNQIGVNLLNLDSPLGDNNSVYSNNLVSNLSNALAERSYAYPLGKFTNNGTDAVSWDNDSLGNYWSNYNGSGVYVIDENNVDHYPLSQPVNINSIAPTATSYLPTDRNAPHLDPIVYLIPVSVIVAVVVLSVLLYRRHRKTSSLKQ